MKTGEIYTHVLSDPKAKFKSVGELLGDFTAHFNEAGKLVDRLGDLVYPRYDMEWELVRESVDFMTAVKAFDDLKVVECVGGNLPEIKVYKPSTTRMRPMLDQRGTAVTSDEILNCEWFVIE